MAKACPQLQFVIAPIASLAIKMTTADSFRCQQGGATFCGFPNVGEAIIKGRCPQKNVALKAVEKIAWDDGHPHA